MVRALEMRARAPGRRVFEDAMARHLLGPRLRLVLAVWPLTSPLFAIHERLYRGMVFEVLGRARFARERLALRLEEGMGQVVILGAGFDATAWGTGPVSAARVFEVDHPDTQRLKRSRLARAGIPEPPGLSFVPLDLASDGLARALREAGHDPGRATFVTALGLLPYLPERRVERLFGEIGSLCAGGSEVLYTYFGRRALDPARAPAAARRVARRLARSGEPFLSSAEPEEMACLAAASGLEQVETLDGAAMTARYFASRGDRRVVGDWIHLSRSVAARQPGLRRAPSPC